MAPRTHIVRGERRPVDDHGLGYPVGDRSAEDVASDITAMHMEIREGYGKVLGHYALDPHNGGGDTLYVVVDYPDDPDAAAGGLVLASPL